MDNVPGIGGMVGNTMYPFKNMDLVLPILGKEAARDIHDIIVRRMLTGKIGIINQGQYGSIPVLYANGDNLPEAWENSMLCLFGFGNQVKTAYDKPGDPPSIDATMIMIVDDPLSEPRIHRSFPGGLEDLEEYCMEVVDGVKNHWVRDPNDPNDTRWEYTYNGRMRNYMAPKEDGGFFNLDQFETMAQMLAKTHHSRRAQIVTWQPWQDLFVDDPACWQSLWGRITPIFEGGSNSLLNLNMRFRSRDSYKAAFMNTFAFTNLGKKLLNRIKEIGPDQNIRMGRFMDQSDSYHIYGSYFEEFVNSFFKLLLNRPKFEDRTWDMEFALPIMEEARPAIIEKIRVQDENHNLNQ